ncbi:hypothetical protein SO802_034044 [Lithocarpus litseifolius]|uniref:Transmembrane protein n=1 Tax=Lithocarpus litseifolius TaxID=425828 RepID=A0AAW2BEW3_9ROSI
MKLFEFGGGIGVEQWTSAIGVEQWTSTSMVEPWRFMVVAVGGCCDGGGGGYGLGRIWVVWIRFGGVWMVECG